MSEIQLTPANGIRTDIPERTRADVSLLGQRVSKRIPAILDNTSGIDPMSFVQENPADQMAAYAFSQYWVWRVWII